MRIDAHQHFWKYSPANYAWISDKIEGLKRDFLPKDLMPHLIADGFSGSIAVQARQDLDETRWLLELADNNEFIKGVVGWVDLCSPNYRRNWKSLPQTSNLSECATYCRMSPMTSSCCGLSFGEASPDWPNTG